ncbi:hypothetical protein HAX54_002810 [Datura stramonium]|uniref:Non-specific serine/threonine protein kinase n=1 Tax=Datura stramonium TaxID=4076 RepID=A0ABS8T6M7_DATST|nr:hypothetical protein [Datura stramonium]
MYAPLFYLVLHFSLFLVAPISSSSIITSLSKGSSLSTSLDTFISSPNGDYVAGFHSVGENAYSFAIWFNDLVNGHDKKYTVVWMANRDDPVNGRHSLISLRKSGDLVLTDAGQRPVWSTGTQSNASVELKLQDNGNLVLAAESATTVIWQSFDTPTDTLLPGQPLTKNSKLVSLRSSTNYSSGFYKLQFADNNVLQLLYEGLEMSGVYWPPSWQTSVAAGRSTYNNTKIAVLDRLGQFKSTDRFSFRTADHGDGGIQRRLTLDIDGNIRVYSFNKQKTNWEVSWQLNWQPCMIHGLCGLNTLCTYSHDSGRKCSCLNRHKMKNVTDWSYGCEPDFKLSCPNRNSVDLVQLRHVEFFGYDFMYRKNRTLEQCKQECIDNCDCKGFQFNFEAGDGVYSCYLKTLLFNGYQSPSWGDSVYIKLPKDSDEERPNGKLQCESTHEVVLDRIYKRKQQHGWLKSFIGFTAALGAFEIICLVSYLITTLKRSNTTFGQVYIPVVNRFKRFTYAELKKATSNFRDEIGQGSGGVVYKGKLPDNRIVAIKCLKLEANQGEAEFLAESPNCSQRNNMDDDEEIQDTTMLVTWVREKMNRVEQSASQIQQVVDVALDCNYNLEKMEVVIRVALQCAEEDKDARPTMSQVVDMLQA